MKMTRAEHNALAEERFRIQINLVRSCLDIVEMCVNDPSDLAQAVVSMLIDNVVMLTEEMQEDMNRHG